MIMINKINWLSEEAKEAEVHISDGDFSIVCFSHPFNQIVGDNVPLPLYTLNARDIYRLNTEGKFAVEKRESAFEYNVSGRIINTDNNQVKVGEFIIELDLPFPNDIQTGDYVSFVCDRIDLY